MRDDMDLKFPECLNCKNLCRLRTCDECDNGEFFDEVDPEGLDSLFDE